MALLSFKDLQKIWISPKFGDCGSKIAPATLISILNFSRAWQSYFIIVHNHDFLYHLGAILKKKKKLFSNFSFLVEDTEKWIKHHFLSIKIHNWSKFQGHISKKRTATPLRISKLKWAWRAQFLSHNLQILGKFIYFEDLQMIEKPCLAKSNGIEFGKKWSSPLSMCKGVLA